MNADDADQTPARRSYRIPTSFSNPLNLSNGMKIGLPHPPAAGREFRREISQRTAEPFWFYFAVLCDKLSVLYVKKGYLIPFKCHVIEVTDLWVHGSRRRRGLKKTR